MLRRHGLSELDLHVGFPEFSMRRRRGLLHDPTVPQRHLSGCGNVGDVHTYTLTRNDNAHAYPHCVADTDGDRQYTYWEYTNTDTVSCSNGDPHTGANDHRFSGSHGTPRFRGQCD
jgi:hypothetical protein